MNPSFFSITEKDEEELDAYNDNDKDPEVPIVDISVYVSEPRVNITSTLESFRLLRAF